MGKRRTYAHNNFRIPSSARSCVVHKNLKDAREDERKSLQVENLAIVEIAVTL